MMPRSDTFRGMSVRTTWDGEVATIEIHRSEKRNALALQQWEELRDAARGCAAARAVILTGDGGHFCAGMDLSPGNPLIGQILPIVQGGDFQGAMDLILMLKDCLQAIAELSCPTFAAIEGACVGGGYEVALACDVRIAAETASIGLPEARIGMIPDLGGCVRLTRLVGPGRAADLIVTGRRVSGAEAFRLGMVERVVAEGQAMAEARQAARDVLIGGPQAVQLALNVVRMVSELGQTEALALESRAGAMALISGEPQEGVTAFFEKRAPDWKMEPR